MKRLLDILREDLQLTGTKEGCGEGECGACSVVLNGELVNSCLVPACQLQSAQVLTVEGITSEDGQLAPVQQCFIECGASQCGICTPGMIIAAHCFLEGEQPATDHAVREALAGNLCRCTGYQKIIDAVQLAAGELKKRKERGMPPRSLGEDREKGN
jgi:carbon-monoxide dehydrogenase small subunit